MEFGGLDYKEKSKQTGSLASLLSSAPKAQSFFRGGEEKKMLATIGEGKSRGGLNDNALGDALLRLGKVTRNKRAARKLARNKDTIKTLLNSLKSRPRFAAGIQYCVPCLGNLAVDEVSTEEMIDEGTLEVLMNVQRLNPYNESIAQVVNQTISKFAMNDYLADMIMSRIGGDNLIFSLKKHIEPETLTSTCDALTKLMTSEENVDKLVDKGLIEALAHVAKTNKDNPDVLAMVAKASAKIGQYPKYANQLMDSGLVEDLMEAMKRYPDNAELLKNGASLLGNLAASGDAGIIERLKKLGAVDLIVAALERFPEDENMLAAGAVALRLLAGEEDIGSALALIEEGNIHTKAMAMGKVAGLSLVESNVDYIISHGGLPTIIAAIRSSSEGKDSSHLKVLEAGCRALMRLAMSEQNIYAIMEAKGVHVMVGIMRDHVDNAKVASAALGALGKMITRKDNAEYILRCGGLQAALGVMAAHPDDETVAKYGLAFLHAMCQHASTRQAVVEQGGIQQIVSIIKEHMDNEDLIDSALATLGLCEDEDGFVDAMKDADGIRALLDVLLEHPENADIAREALHLLEAIAKDPTTLDALRDAGALDTIMKVLGLHPDDADIQETGGRVIGLMAGEQQLRDTVENVKGYLTRLENTPAMAKPILRQMGPAVRLLSNLCMIEDNIEALARENAAAVLSKAFILASKAPQSDDRDAIMNAAVQGLLQLSKHEGQRMPILHSGVLDAMLAHIQSNPDTSEFMAQNIMRMLANMSESPEVAEAMLKDGTLDKIMDIVKTYPLNEDILLAASEIIGNLATTPENCDIIMTSGGAEVLLEALYANMNDPDRLLRLLESLPALSQSADACREMINLGTLEAIFDIMRKYPEIAEIIIACIKAVGTMLICPEIPEAVGQKGGLPLFLQALRDHYRDELLVQMDMVLLDSLALVESNVELLLEEDLGTIDLIVWAASSYESNDIIVTTSEHLLAILRGWNPHLLSIDPEQILTAEEAGQMLQALTEDYKQTGALVGILSQVAQAACNPISAKVLLESGGMESLSAMILEHKDNEEVFKAAALALQALIGNAEHDANLMSLLQEPQVVEALVEMVKPHANFVDGLNEAEIAEALGMLGLLAAQEAGIEQLLNQDAFEPLLKFLSSSSDPLVLAAAAKLLAKLTNDERAARKFAGLADIRALIRAMRDNPDQVDFLRYAIYLLANLASVDESVKETIGVEGGVSETVTIMKRHVVVRPLVESAAYALGNLTYQCETNMSFVVASRGINAILQAMDQYPTEADLLESSICVLCNLCYRNDANKARIVSDGGARNVVMCMLDNVNEKDLLLTSFRCLGNLAFHPPNVSVIIREGGVQGIVAAMTVHSRDYQIINVAIRVLANLASDVDHESMQIMAQEGAVQAIVDVALEHPNQKEIEVGAFGCLCNFAKEANNSRMIVRQDGLTAVSNAVRALLNEPELCMQAVRLLLALTFNEKNVEDMLEQKSIPVIIECMANHPLVKDLLVASLQSFSNLAYTKTAAVLMGAEGVIPIVIDVMKKQQDDAYVLSECFHSLGALCRDEGNATAMAKLVMMTMEGSLRTHFTQLAFLSNAFTFLGNMCVFPTAATECVDTNVVSAILFCVEQLMNDGGTMMRACRALENLALSANVVKDHLSGQGVIQAMMQVKVAFQGRQEEVVIAAQRVIDRINQRIESGLETIKVSRQMRSAKDIWEEKEAAYEPLSQEAKNFLTAGEELRKHSNHAPPRPRMVMVTPDLKWLVWKKGKQIKENARMKTVKIRSIEPGRCTPQLQRTARWSSKPNAREECAFAVFGRDAQNKVRTVDLEADSEEKRDLWIKYLDMLVEHLKAVRKMNSQF